MDAVELTPYNKSPATKSELDTQHLANGHTTANAAETEDKPTEAGSATKAKPHVGNAKAEEKREHVGGFKLFTILASVTLAAFLMLLDGSIVGVVSRHTRLHIALKKETDRVLLS